MLKKINEVMHIVQCLKCNFIDRSPVFIITILFFTYVILSHKCNVR